MIDTHCHLLPGLDDGPADEGEALGLARALVADGVRTVVCTPHLSARFPVEHDDASRAAELLRARLDAERIPLALELTAEVDPLAAYDAPLEELTRRALAGRFVLVEVTRDVSAPFFPAIADRLAPAGLAPVFAHPERSRAIQRSPAPLADARAAGAVVQIVAPSLLGRWREAVEECAWRLVEEGLADLLASDAHGVARRRVHLAEAARAVARRHGAAAAEALTQANPASVLAGRYPGATK